MKLIRCDRCDSEVKAGRSDGTAVHGTVVLGIGFANPGGSSTLFHTTHDLCQQCAKALRNFLNPPREEVNA